MSQDSPAEKNCDQWAFLEGINTHPSLIKEKEFTQIRDILYKVCGINLNSSKKVMVETRLGKRLKILNLNSYQEYIHYLNNTPAEISEFINALTTNKTDFFRESDHFDFLQREILPQFKNKKMRIWSAASSTGEEIYTLAIIFEEFLRNSAFIDYKIIGTDIDTSVLEDASLGIYKQSEILPIPPHLVQHYFLRNHSHPDLYKVSPQLQKNIKFRQFNLLESSFPVPIQFDIIFLRNVLIYFDRPTIQKVIANICRYLKKEGYLFIGHSETLNGIEHNLEGLKSSIYKKRF